jgi:hypothetical protein
MNRLSVLSISFLLCFACANSSNKSRDNVNAVNDSKIPANAIPVLYFDYLHLHLSIDSAEGTFLFDTGFDNLCIDSIFYYSNKLDYINSTAGKIYGIGNAYQEMNLIRDTIDFSIEGRRYSTSFVPVLDLKPIGGDYVDGLLGTKHFNRNVVEINYPKGYICLHETIDSVDVSGYSIIALKNTGFHYFIPATLKINDSIIITGDFLVDTATPGSTLTSYVAFKNNLSRKVDHKILYYTMYGGIGGESSGYDFAVDTLKIADYNLSNVILSYSLDTAGSLAAQEYIGILGNNILERFDLLFDFINSNLYLRPNEDFIKPFIFDRMGFSYVDRCKTMGGWIVAGMYENSPAEKKGLRIDDKIISVNEVPVEKIPYEEQKEYFEKIRKVEFVVSRAGSLQTIKFKLAPLCDF